MKDTDNSQNIQVRPYIPKDYPAVKKIYEEGGLFDKVIDKEAGLNAKSEKDSESLLVAAKNQQVVGTVSIVEDGRIALFFRLAVAKNERNQGIGAKLVRAAEKILRQRGHKLVNILIFDREEEVKDYYERLGYKRGSLHLWMRKELK